MRTTAGLRSLMVAAGLTLGSSASAQMTELEYNDFLAAMFEAETVRYDYSTDQRAPRVFATAVAMSVFADENPNASAEDIGAFAAAYDAGLAGAIAGDPELLRYGSLIRAVRFIVDVSDAPGLEGFNTDVAVRTMNLLGIDFTVSPESTITARQARLARIEDSRVINPAHNSRVGDLIVAGLNNSDADGDDNGEIRAALVGYFVSQSYGVFANDVSRYAGIQAEFNTLPDYATFMAGSMNDPNYLSSELDQALGTIVSSLEEKVIDIADRDIPTLRETAMSNEDPSDAVDLVLEQMRERSRQRAALEFNRRLAGMSPWPEAQERAEDIAFVGETALESDEVATWVNFGLDVLGGGLGIASGIFQGDPFAAAAGGVGLVGTVFNQFWDSGPTPDEQIMMQLDDIQDQLADLGEEMHERFDRIDERLDILYDTTVAGFDAVLMATDNIAAEVQALRDDISMVSYDLHRVERRLIGVLSEQEFQDLILEINGAIGWQDNSPSAMTFEQFLDFENVFSTWCTDPEINTFAGDDGSIGFDDAAESLSNVDEMVNVLSRIAGDITGSPLSPSQVANPVVWAQPADALGQLYREQPWYGASIPNPAFQAALTPGRDARDAFRAARSPGLIGMLETMYLNLLPVLENDIYAFNGGPPSIMEDYINTVTPYTGFIDIWGDPLADLGRASTPSVALRLMQFPTDTSNCPNTSLLQTASTSPAFRLTPYGRDVENAYHTGQVVSAIMFVDTISNTLIEVRTSITVARPAGSSETYGVTLRFRPQVSFGHNNWEEPSNCIMPYFQRAMRSTTWEDNGALWNGIIALHNTPSIGSFAVGFIEDPSDDRLPARMELLEVVPANSANRGITEERFAEMRVELGDLIEAAADEPTSQIFDEVAEMNDIVALLDAYLSLGIPSDVESNHVIRAALRGGSPEFDGDLALNGDAFARASEAWPSALDEFSSRLMIASDQWTPALDSEAADDNHVYLSWAIANLEGVNRDRRRLAHGDTYPITTSGSVSTLNVDAANGVLANDVTQDQVTLQAVIVDNPDVGSVTLNSDGSFEFSANTTDLTNAGGTSFTYFTRGSFAGLNPNETVTVNSETATVVIVPGDTGPSCACDWNGTGELNSDDFFDYLVAYLAGDADYNQDAETNSDDFFDFLGCFLFPPVECE